MSLGRRLVRGIRGLADRDAARREAADEIEHYLEQAVQEHIAHGLSPEEARRAARLELGSVSGAREQVVRYGWENAVADLAGDLRYAARRLRTRPGFTLASDTPVYAVVGMVGDVRQVSLALDQAEAVYVPSEQWPFSDRVMSLGVKARGDPVSLIPALRAAVWSVNRGQAIARVATMEDLVSASAAERRFAARLFQAFALVALVLAAAGIYGVLSGMVAERTREIGVRAALGATRGSILKLVVGQGMRLAGLGIAIGLAADALATRALDALLYGVSRLDPVTFALGLGLLAGVALAACGVPAWRAARVDPALTLRGE